MSAVSSWADIEAMGQARDSAEFAERTRSAIHYQTRRFMAFDWPVQPHGRRLLDALEAEGLDGVPEGSTVAQTAALLARHLQVVLAAQITPGETWDLVDADAGESDLGGVDVGFSLLLRHAPTGVALGVYSLLARGAGVAQRYQGHAEPDEVYPYAGLVAAEVVDVLRGRARTGWLVAETAELLVDERLRSIDYLAHLHGLASSPLVATDRVQGLAQLAGPPVDRTAMILLDVVRDVVPRAEPWVPVAPVTGW